MKGRFLGLGLLTMFGCVHKEQKVVRDDLKITQQAFCLAPNTEVFKNEKTGFCWVNSQVGVLVLDCDRILLADICEKAKEPEAAAKDQPKKEEAKKPEVKKKVSKEAKKPAKK